MRKLPENTGATHDRPLRGPRRRRRTSGEDLRQPLAFALGAAIPGYLALDNGGFEIVVRQTVFAAIWWLLALGFAFGVLPRVRLPRGAGLALAGTALLCGVTVASLNWTASDARSMDELARIIGYAGVVVLAWCCLGPGTWRAAAAGLTTSALAISAIAVASRLSPEAFPRSAIEGVAGTERLSYPLDYWNGLAAWAAMAATMGLAWSVDGRNWRLRSASLAAVPVAVLTVYLTYSRGGAVALAIGIALALALSRNRRRAVIHAGTLLAVSIPAVLAVRSQPAIADGTSGEGGFAVVVALLVAAAVCWRVGLATRSLRTVQADDRDEARNAGRRQGAAAHRRRLLLGAAVIAIAAAFAIGVSGAGSALVDEVAEGDPTVAPGEDPSARFATAAGNRPQYWDSAVDAFGTQPLRGIGPGTYRYWWAQHGDAPELVSDAHSLYLETLAELGLLGLVGLGLAFGGLALGAFRGRSAAGRGSAAGTAMLAGAGVYVFAAGFDWMWELTSVSVLGIGTAAVLGTAGSERVRRRRHARTPGLIAATLVAAVAGAIQVPGIVSAERSSSADAQLEIGDAAEALALAEDAVSAAPWEASSYAVRARVEQHLGALDEARADAIAAVDREPLEPEHELLLAEVEAALGDAIAARSALERAFELSPRSPRFRDPDVVRLLDRIERSSPPITP